MIDLYYAHFSQPFETVKYQAYLQLLPQEMQHKVGRYMRWQDAHSSLIGKLLLIEGLKKYGYDHTRLQDIRYSKYDRPYLDDLEFNISHSGQYVLCALSNNAKIGVDVEEVRPIDFNDFDRQFTKAEWDVIHSFADPLHGFYNMWTKKEAIVKADGKGLNIPLEDINRYGKKQDCLMKTNMEGMLLHHKCSKIYNNSFFFTFSNCSPSNIYHS